jgi:VIT1/CCC1 family predicted Fe2+/Mn2+ transporter
MSDDEVERLKELRESQIRGRDPRKKDNKLHGEISRKLQKSRRVTINQLLDEMPAKWLYMYIGFFLGVFIGLALITIFPGALWAQLLALVVLLFLTLAGRLYGQAEDWRKKL